MTNEAINLDHKFGLFSEQWKPKVIAEMNDYQFKIVKIEGHLGLKKIELEEAGAGDIVTLVVNNKLYTGAAAADGVGDDRALQLEQRRGLGRAGRRAAAQPRADSSKRR